MPIMIFKTSFTCSLSMRKPVYTNFRLYDQEFFTAVLNSLGTWLCLAWMWRSLNARIICVEVDNVCRELIRRKLYTVNITGVTTEQMYPTEGTSEGKAPTLGGVAVRCVGRVRLMSWAYSSPGGKTHSVCTSWFSLFCVCFIRLIHLILLMAFVLMYVDIGWQCLLSVKIFTSRLKDVECRSQMCKNTRHSRERFFF